jgi:hypothetical protein
VGTFTLTGRKTGKGSVRSTRPGIACGRDCVETFARGAIVQLTARPAAGSRFKRWGGDCAGTQARCSLRMNERRTAIARFVPIA